MSSNTLPDSDGFIKVGIAVGGKEVITKVGVGDAGITNAVGVAVGGLDTWVFVGEAGTTIVVDVAVGGMTI